MWIIPENAWMRGQALWPEPEERSILGRMPETLARHGNLVALDDRRRSLTFNSFWGSVGEVEFAIRASGSPDGPVGILLRADALYPIAVFACLAAGRPSVLLDAGMPAPRVADLLRQTGATLLLVASGEEDATAEFGLPRVGVSASLEGRQPSADTLGFDAPAFIICTSGSTGRPKAIVHSQRTLSHKAYCQAMASGLRAGDLCLSLSPPSTVAGPIGMLACAMAGVGLRFMDLRVEGIAGLLEALRTRPITVLRAAPSTLRLLTAMPDAREILCRLRSITLISEPVLRADVAQFRACIRDGTVLLSLYGSTESGSIYWQPSGDDAYDPVRTPAGRLVPGTEAAILDEDGQPCGVGETGELVLRSANNALGEWQDGRCVAGSLTPDPADPARRIHRTGDLAWCAEDGVFVVLGRNDRMLKVNGQRIEPAEIEAAVRGCTGVADCAVVGRRRGAVQAIVAFVTLRAGAVAGDMRAELRPHLPGAMMPSRIVVLDALPRLAGGKVDLVALNGMAGGSNDRSG